MILSLFDNEIISVIQMILLFFAMFKVFKKCGVKPGWAFVPGARDYKLAEIADRRSDGIKYMILQFMELIVRFMIPDTFDQLDEINGKMALRILVLFGIILFVGIGSFVYSIRIFTGLCRTFGVKKSWVWLMVLFGRFLPLLFWGVGSKYVPNLTPEEEKKEGADLSGMTAAAVDQGLSINIEERTAMDSLKKKTLLRDIHLNIEPGHMVLLLGGSGAGKTTFVNAVNGYEKAKANIVLNGKNIYDNYEEMKYSLGFVPQMDLIRGNDSVNATLMDAAKLRLPKTYSAADRRKRVDEMLDFFGLEPVRDKLCSKLSGGQRKRLSIAMEYISNPELFILDEPDSGLDGVMARELMEGLRKIADEGRIVIVITHSPDRVIDLFDDVIVLAKDSGLTGRLTYYGPVEDARKFFERDMMERIILRINRTEEGGEGLADRFIQKYAEVCNG